MKPLHIAVVLVVVVLAIGVSFGLGIYLSGSHSSTVSKGSEISLSGTVSAYGDHVEGILFVSSTGQQVLASVASGGSYSVSLPNDNWYQITVDYTSASVGISTCSVSSGITESCSYTTTAGTYSCEYVPRLLVNVTSSTMTDDIVCS